MADNEFKDTTDITVWIKEDVLKALDDIAAKNGYSRDKLINIMLRNGIDNIEIQ